jgi:hypothetical protein
MSGQSAVSTKSAKTSFDRISLDSAAGRVSRAVLLPISVLLSSRDGRNQGDAVPTFKIQHLSRSHVFFIECQGDGIFVQHHACQGRVVLCQALTEGRRGGVGGRQDDLRFGGSASRFACRGKEQDLHLNTTLCHAALEISGTNNGRGRDVLVRSFRQRRGFCVSRSIHGAGGNFVPGARD